MARFTKPLASLLCFLPLLTGAVAHGDEPAKWRIGLAKVVITPSERIPMAGYAARTAPFETVEQDLYAKIAVLEDEQGHRGMLITADLIGFFGELSDAICRRIGEETGLTREQILLNASHTHAGPTLNPEQTGEAHGAKVKAYVDELTRKIAQAATQAVKDLQPAQLAYGRGVAKFVMNRREFTSRGVILGVQPSGLADRSVPLLAAKDAAGKPLCVIFGAACHNTTLGGDNYAVTGDYAGFAQAHIEENLPGVQAMFVLGCGGDANPYPRGTMAHARQHGEELGREALRLLESELKPVAGPLRTLYAPVDLPLQTVASRAEAEELAQSRASYQRYVGERMLRRMEAGEPLPTHYQAPLALWQFGDDLTLAAISGETVVDYVKLVEEAIGPLNLWVAGYSNDVFGYLPSARVLREGGYETRGLIRGGVGLFAPQAQDAVVQKIAELAQQAGRK